MRTRHLFRLLASLNAIDVPVESRFHAFLLSSRLSLWPAIILSSLAFGRLVGYEGFALVLIAFDLCLVASISFLFNDICDRNIDRANRIHRWSIESKRDAQFFWTAAVGSAAIILISFVWLTGIAIAGVIVSAVTGVIYSIYCKRVFLLGNIVAAGLSLSPGVIICADVAQRGMSEVQAVQSLLAFLLIGFLLLLSREIKFDEFDLNGDRLGKRVTVPMYFGELGLRITHVSLGAAAIGLLFLTCALSGRFATTTNLVLGGMVSLVVAGLLVASFRASSKEKFYKRSRIVMLFLPLYMLLGM